MLKRTWGALAGLAILFVTPLQAQTVAPLEVGQVAPDFALPGATRYGELTDPVRLSDFKGNTVVLAFFFRARTRG